MFGVPLGSAVARRGRGGGDSLRRVRSVIISLPPWAITLILLGFFTALSFAAREIVRRRCGDEDREELADQAKNLLTGVAATFGFFVGFAITVSWGAVSAAQNAVEQQAAAVKQMSRELANISDRAQSAELTGLLRSYATAAVTEDTKFLRRGQAVNLPSGGPLDSFEDALHAYAYGPQAPAREVSGLISAAATLGSSAAGVAAVSNRALPTPLGVLLLVVGALAAIITGITTVSYRRPVLIVVWSLIPAISIAVVASLAFPFAVRSGLPLASLQAVVAGLGG